MQLARPIAHSVRHELARSPLRDHEQGRRRLPRRVQAHAVDRLRSATATSRRFPLRPHDRNLTCTKRRKDAPVGTAFNAADPGRRKHRRIVRCPSQPRFDVVTPGRAGTQSVWRQGTVRLPPGCLSFTSSHTSKIQPPGPKAAVARSMVEEPDVGQEEDEVGTLPRQGLGTSLEALGSAGCGCRND